MKRAINNLLDLKNFLNDADHEALTNTKAEVQLGDEEGKDVFEINNAEVLSDNVYVNKKNPKEFGTLEQMKAKYGDKFKEEWFKISERRTRIILNHE